MILTLALAVLSAQDLSLIPGGITGDDAFEAARGLHPEHYADVGFLRRSYLAADMKVWASYERNGQIFWCPIKLHKGEEIFTDRYGNRVRGRCGNRISDVPQTPVESVPPPPQAFETPPPVDMPPPPLILPPPPPPEWPPVFPPFVVEVRFPPPPVSLPPGLPVWTPPVWTPPGTWAPGGGFPVPELPTGTIPEPPTLLGALTFFLFAGVACCVRRFHLSGAR